jgi:regulator of sigma E protease
MLLASTFSLLRFGAVFSVLVFVHEAGHFLMAKWRRVAVEEFGFGLPPRLWGKKFGDTIYSLNWIPLGGFVKLKGEDPEAALIGDADSFRVKSNVSRAAIILAGVLGNLLLAWLIFSFLFTIGNPRVSGQVVVEEVIAGSPAEKVGLQKQDTVLAVDGRQIETTDELVFLIKQEVGTPVRLRIDRAGEVREINVVPRSEPPTGEGPLGIKIALIDPQINLVSYPFVEALGQAASEIVRTLKDMFWGLATTIQRLFTRGEVPTEVTGVIGIKAMTDVAAEMGKRFFLQFIALLNLNLFLFNLLPVPALDGGRLLFVGLEVLLRRKLNPKVEKLANNLGFAFLLLLSALITIKDIATFW